MGVQRVQNVASLSKDEIPAEFVRAEKDQPGLTTVRGVNLEVPIIDFSNPDDEKVMQQIVAASCQWGMYQIVNHGIPSEVIAKLQDVGKTFFELPQEEKELVAKIPGSMQGYGTTLEKETKKGWVDHLFHIVWPTNAINYRFWPKNPPSYREANEEYVKYLHKVEEKLFKSLSLGLGLEGNELREAAGGEKMEYLLKINYYPPCPRPDLAVGVPAHTDMSTFTLLVPNEIQGLQAFRDGHWYDVKYIPNALVVHIGDQLEILSNGKYKAVNHRTTVNLEKTRMSWPVFLEPPKDHVVGPHPKVINEENPPKYKTKSFGDYAYCKLNRIPQ
ncbi:hypothetical protein L6164_016158 [Bauhinia variegata]|uniref:Uncharacterized protein n=1 Tax=Bauhinia variegata TaxID=167791 RepID=A0ACB9NMP0_BAUVA|nr:hypothetical protein L6164_016158 [Bauhinia variegata]